MPIWAARLPIDSTPSAPNGSWVRVGKITQMRVFFDARRFAAMFEQR
jgi:hypothetical protein